MAINGRAKGSAGEREFCEWLYNKLELEEKPTRNLEQTRDSGADIVCVEPFIFEVKRCQRLALRDWWLQVSKAQFDDRKIRVVAFRQNQQPWRFLISAKYIGLEVGYIQLEESEAIRWLNIMKST